MHRAVRLIREDLRAEPMCLQMSAYCLLCLGSADQPDLFIRIFRDRTEDSRNGPVLIQSDLHRVAVCSFTTGHLLERINRNTVIPQL